LALGVVAGALLARPVSAETVPAPEQLLAATLHADDLANAKIEPGGWWDDAPEFNDRLESDASPGMLALVMGHVVGRPDEAPAELATSLRLYRAAAASADDFAATAALDRQDYGTAVEGPKLGDQSRYLRQAADDQHEGGAALRFQYGRYLARIDVGGKAGSLAPDQLAALGKIVIQRLAAIDAGKLSAPALPDLAKSLPPAESAFAPVLGTATMARQAWSWIWSNRNSSLVVSPRLAAMLRDETSAGGAPVMRRYVIAAAPSNVAEVTLMPFPDGDTAAQYLAEIKREDPRRAAITSDEGDVTISPPIPDVAPAYRADLRAGRYVVEVSCFAPFAPTASGCETAVTVLAERAKRGLPAK
jgi:hypothetical protein